MRRKHTLVLLALLLSACAPAPAPPDPTPFPTAPGAVTPATEPTASPTATPTPAPTPSPTPDCRRQPGRIDSLSIPSALLAGELFFQVYLPACPAPAEGYPALYLLHGQGAGAGQWADFGLAEQMDARIQAGGQPFLVVMPQEDDFLADPSGSAFGDALTGNLVPWVDENYPTCAERGCRAVGGLSRGAAWAVRLGFSRPELFSAVGAHSLPPFYGDMNRLPTWLAAMPDGEPPALYLDIGASDRYLSPAAEFQALLVRLRLAHEWHLNEGGHEDSYWAGQLPVYLEWYEGVLEKTSRGN